MRSNNWLILYDIREPKRLNKVEKVVSSYGWRVQKSVFEIDAPQKSIEELKKVLSYFIDQEEDFVLFFKVCERDWQKRESYGHEQINNIQNDKYTIL